MLLRRSKLPHTSECVPQCISARSYTLWEMQRQRCQTLVQTLDSARKITRITVCILRGHWLVKNLYLANKPLTWHCRMHSWCFLGLQPNWKVANWPVEQTNWLGTTAGSRSAQTHWIWEREPPRSSSAWCPSLLYSWWWWCCSTTEMIHGLIRHAVISTRFVAGQAKTQLAGFSTMVCKLNFNGWPKVADVKQVLTRAHICNSSFEQNISWIDRVWKYADLYRGWEALGLWCHRFTHSGNLNLTANHSPLRWH